VFADVKVKDYSVIEPKGSPSELDSLNKGVKEVLLSVGSTKIGVNTDS
jgi:hypothetical protein